jgi:hypothetical protein
VDSQCIVHTPAILTVLASADNVLWIQGTGQVE